MSSETTYSKIPKISCLLCKSELAINMFDRHYATKQCLSGGKFILKNCEYCGLEFNKPMNVGSHIATCKHRPEYKKRDCSQLNTPEAREKAISSIKRKHAEGAYKLAQEKRKGIYKGKEWTKEAREKHCETMLQVAKDNPESYSSSNRGRVKEIIKYGIKFQGNWEVLFYEFCLDNRIECIRNYSSFSYMFDKERSYYPDFYLPEFDAYVEIKGYKTERDVAKWSYFPKNLVVIQKNEIQLIQKKLFKINDLF